MPLYYIDILFILSILVSIYISYLSLQLDFIGKKLFLGISLSIIFWLIGAGIEAHTAISTILDILGMQLYIISSIFGAVFVFLFAIRYTTGFQFSRKQLAILFIVPAINVLLVLTNPWFNLMWTDRIQLEFLGLLYTKFTLGPGMFIHAIYSYSLLIITIALFIRVMVMNKHSFIKQSLLIIVGISIPLVLSILFILGDIFPINPTPFGLVITQLFFLIAILHFLFNSSESK